MSIFGFLGGEQTDKSTNEQDTELHQTISGTTDQTQSGSETSTGKKTGTSQQDTTQVSDTATSQESKTTGTKDSVSTQKGVTDLFGEKTFGTLESIFSKLGDKFTGDDLDLVGKLTGGLEDFDSEKFISNIMGKAESSIDATINPQMNRLASQVGGNANSMVQLMRNKAATDKAAQLGGVEADATVAANDIMTKNLSAALGAKGSDADLLGLIGGLLKGGKATTTTEASAADVTSQESEAGSRSVTEDIAQMLGITDETSATELTSLINSLINQNQVTDSKQHTEGTGTQTEGPSLSKGLGNVASFLKLGA